MVVALRALHGETAKRADGILHHVIAIQMTGDLPIDLCFRHLGMTDVVPRSCCDEPERCDAISGSGIERITCDLLLNEAGVRLVVVEGTDDVVAVRPCIHARRVFVIAVGFAVMHKVEPMPCPTLAVTWGCEEIVYQLFIR